MASSSKVFRRERSGVSKAKKADELVSDFADYYQLTSEVLGAGSYAEVKLGIHKTSGRKVAVKIINKTSMKEKDLKKLHKEVDILRMIKHKNVVRFYDAFEEESRLFIVMEYITGGELFNKIVDEENKYTESDVKNMVRTMAQALKYCKEKGIIHRDIKPENLLLTTTGPDAEIKLADFNLSMKLHPEETEFSIMQTMCGTPNYVAPEVLSGLPYDYKVDIWSLGVITYLLLSGGYLPFFVAEEGEEGRKRLLQKVKLGKWEFTPEFAWSTVSEDAKDFVRRAMCKRPVERFTYEELLSHKWLNAKGFLEEPAQEVPINTEELTRLNAKRKMMTSSMLSEAASEFGKLMNAVDESSIGFGKLKNLVGTSTQQSGLEAFNQLL